MGIREASRAKEYLKKKFPHCFRSMSTMVQAMDEMSRVCDGRKMKFLYVDFSIKFMYILWSGKYGSENGVSKKITGSSIVYTIRKYLEEYCRKMGISAIVLAIDGNHDDRPVLKVKRTSRGRPMKSCEVRMSHSECNLSAESWIASGSDNAVRGKVMGYISKELCAQWAEAQRGDAKVPDLIVDSAPVLDGCGNAVFSAYRVTGGVCSQVEGALGSEGEQIIYHYMDRFAVEFPDAAHVVDGFTDTDHFSYCLLHQDTNSSSQVVLRMRGVGKEPYTYVVDVRAMREGIVATPRSSGSLVVQKFVLMWGIAMGNDFTCVTDGGKTRSLRSAARGISLDKLIDSGVRSEELVRSSPVGYVVDAAAMRRVVRSSAKCRIGKVGEEILGSIVERSDWCLNYFSHPSNASFLSFDEFRALRRGKRKVGLPGAPERKRARR